MKKALMSIAFFPLAAFAARVEVLPSLPTGALPNSEVVTNVVLDVDVVPQVTKIQEFKNFVIKVR